MMFSALVWITFTVLATVPLLNAFVRKNKHKKLPPGPRALPIIGHLHLLGKNPHQDLHNLSKNYGPVMHLKFGFTTNIVVSSPRGAELFLKTNDLVFASRPPLVSAKYMLYEQRDLSFSKYGSYWRNIRKLCTSQLLSTMKVNSFESMRSREVGLLIKSLKKAEKSVVNLSAEVASLSANMSCLMVFGKKYSDEEFCERGFKDVIREVMRLLVAPHLGDYFPFLESALHLDPQGLTRRMKEVSKIFDKFLNTIIDEHQKLDNPSNTFVSTLLALNRAGDIDFEFDTTHIKGVLLDMLAASMDTSATSVEWLLSELFRQPRVMKKVQEELEQIIGLNRMVDESDLDKLKYLDMVVKESFRLHPPVPLLLPHAAMEDCTVEGYHIPKESRILVNAWSIGRDPNTWKDPEKFIPERFDGSNNTNIDVWGQNFELIPFGSGRRGCPGMQLGFIVVRLVVGQLMHCFDWELPKGMLPEEVDMVEEFGLVMSREKPLMAIPTYRLRL
nr:5 beta-pregnan oxidoreductase [Calotropis procera]